MSGMIYAVIVVMWAAFLVPMWLRRHDENAEARSVDKFAGKMRVLARRSAAEPAATPVTGRTVPAASSSQTVSSTVRVLGSDRAGASRTTSAPVVTRAVAAGSSAPGRPVDRTSVRTAASSVIDRTGPTAPRPSRPRERWAETADEEALAVLAKPDLARPHGSGRAPASLAARRRRVLVAVAALTVLLVGLGLTKVLPLWTSAFGWAALIGYLAHLRVQARRSAEIARRRARAQRQQGAPLVDDSRVVRVTPARTARPTTADEEPETAEVEKAAGSWRPVSVPVPTYVTAPKASRAIRRIDLGASEAWTSGRLVADAAAAGKAAAAAAHQESLAARGADDVDVRRAVGD